MELPVLQSHFEISFVDSARSQASALGQVVIGNVIDRPTAGFASVTGLEFRIETDDYEEGGRNDTVLRFPRRAREGEIKLTKGVHKTPELFEWIDGFRRGRGRRRDGVITLRDGAGRPHTVWRVLNAFPVAYEGPSLVAAESDVAIVSLTLGHEGLLQDPGLGVIGGLVQDIGTAIRDLI